MNNTRICELWKKHENQPNEINFYGDPYIAFKFKSTKSRCKFV